MLSENDEFVDSYGSPKDLSSEHAIRMIALFDNEEVGSNSCQGVGAPMMFLAMRRIIGSSAHENVSEIPFECAVLTVFDFA
ncbi:Peptidase_M18 domain-containing protein [Cephalotus follicularis]|uniref:aspartyl aminopeptidase n=1 Tax=Cephalotus follicularis TaxID=3775 RepID=A0A1Q3BHC5_CEPFO|nr:Peptidase_M18 domain-containing protein [Cephalotus follicularis]